MTLNPPSEECLTAMYKEFGSSEKRIKEDVEVLKTWLSLQPHLPHIDNDKCIENMLLRCKCSVERAKKVMDMHFTLKTALPEFFSDRDASGIQMETFMNSIQICVLPNTTKEGHRITFFKVLDKDATHFSSEMFFKVVTMTADIRLQEETSVADIYIYDCANLSMGYLTKMSLTLLKKLEICASQGYRARIKGVHFINAPSIIDMFLTMIKTVLKSKLMDRHHVHTTLDSLHAHVDKDILPVEYGGKEKSLAIIAENWKQKCIEKKQWFLDQETIGKVDESKRPGKSFNSSDLFGFEGTFKQLTVD